MCARGAWWALLGGPSTSPLDAEMTLRLVVLVPAGALVAVTVLTATVFPYLTKPAPLGYGPLALGAGAFSMILGGITHVIARTQQHAKLAAALAAIFSCIVFVSLALFLIVNVRGA